MEVANYTVYETTGGARHALSTIPYRAGRPLLSTPVSADEGERCFELVARDLAGNESAPLAACGRFERPAGADAGVPADAGGAGGLGASGERGADDGGCRCAVAGSRSSALAALGLGLALVLRRRRRRRD